MLQSMSSDDCLRVWDSLSHHVAPDFDAESQVSLSWRSAFKRDLYLAGGVEVDLSVDFVAVSWSVDLQAALDAIEAICAFA